MPGGEQSFAAYCFNGGSADKTDLVVQSPFVLIPQATPCGTETRHDYLFVAETIFDPTEPFCMVTWPNPAASSQALCSENVCAAPPS